MVATAVELQKLKQDFDSKLPSYLDKIHDVWSQIRLVEWNRKLAESLLYYCHKLAGSSAIYGHNEISERLKQIELALGDLLEKDQKNSQAYEVIETNLRNIRINPLDIERELSNTFASKSSNIEHSIIIIDDDQDTGEYLKNLISNIGHNPYFYETIEEAVANLREVKPSLILLDINFPEGQVAGIKAISSIRDVLGYRVPIVMISSRKDMAVRLASMTSGSDGFLTKPVKVSELESIINEKSMATRLEGKRVLIVDDDKSTGLFYRAILKRYQIDTEIVTDPMKTIAKINDYKPHLILMDNVMPGCRGTELAEIIKQDPELFHIPIIFITADNDFELPSKILSLGAKGFLLKPIKEKSFINTVEKALLVQQHVITKFKSNPTLKQRNIYSSQYQFFGDVESSISNSIASVFGLLLLRITNYGNLREKYGLASSTLLLDKFVDTSLPREMVNVKICKFGESDVLILLERPNLEEIESEVNVIAQHLNDVLEHQSEDGKLLFDEINMTLALTTSSNKDNSIEAILSKCQELSKQAKVGGLVSVDLSNTIGSPSKVRSINVNVADLIQKKAFALSYQPIISIEDSSNIYIDTYTRLINSEFDVFAPSEFFNHFSKKEHWVSLDRFVIEKSVDKLKSINTLPDKEIFLIVRLSKQCILNKDNILWLSNIIQNNRVRSQKTLVVSLQEGEFNEHREGYLYFVEKLRLLGCQISLQGYGETSQSIAIRNELKPDLIKIDSKVLKQNKDSKALVAELVQYSSSRSINVIATKIESADRLSSLYQQGIMYFQGNFIEEASMNIDINTKISLF